MNNGKQWYRRDDIVYLSDVLETDAQGIANILEKQRFTSTTSHLQWIAARLKEYEEDGQLRLHLNQKYPDYRETLEPDIQQAYAKVFPIVKNLIGGFS